MVQYDIVQFISCEIGLLSQALHRTSPKLTHQECIISSSTDTYKHTNKSSVFTPLGTTRRALSELLHSLFSRTHSPVALVCREHTAPHGAVGLLPALLIPLSFPQAFPQETILWLLAQNRSRALDEWICLLNY